MAKRRLTVAIDYDDVLATPNNEWAPGAREALTAILTRGHKVIIHTCRANYPAGLERVQTLLGPLTAKVTIHPKPLADLYVDDRGRRFQGDWTPLLTELRRHQ